MLLQSGAAFLLQSATVFFYYKVRRYAFTKCDGMLLQSATAFFITECDSFFYYKVRPFLFIT